MGGGGSPELKHGTISNVVFEVMESGTKITKDLAGLSKQLLGATQSLALDPVKEKTDRTRLIPLLQATKDYWGETDYATSDDRTPFLDTKKDHMGPLTIAAAAERGGVEGIKVETSRLVVTGNAEMLGRNGYRQSEGITVDFAMNALNWLLDREELIGIPPKEKKNVTLCSQRNRSAISPSRSWALFPGWLRCSACSTGGRAVASRPFDFLSHETEKYPHSPHHCGGNLCLHRPL
jgi:hypothetical protein